MDLVEAVKAAGIVGAGGAGFPTHVKLAAKADTFIVNAAECEPLIETDKFLIRSRADDLVQGVCLIGESVSASRKVIAIKAKYKAEIKCLKDAISSNGANVEIFEMETFYPAGDEQLIVCLLTGRSVPERGIPLDVGCVVDNVVTVLNAYDATFGKNVTHRYLSVTGAVAKTIMLKVPIGTKVTSCIEAACPTVSDYIIIMGGPMMGKMVKERDKIESLVITKTDGNIIVLPRGNYLDIRKQLDIEKLRNRTRSACIQCRMCTDLCPRFLTGHNMMPHLVMRNLFREKELNDTQFADAFGTAANCSECGVCEMYACPMQLSPRTVNGYIKGKLAERGIKPPRNMEPKPRPELKYKKTPTGRLIARLGLTRYVGEHPDTALELNPVEVSIPLKQHIGAPAEAVVSVGAHVCEGDLIGKIPEGKLSANVHASINGIVVSVDNNIVIRGDGA